MSPKYSLDEWLELPVTKLQEDPHTSFPAVGTHPQVARPAESNVRRSDFLIICTPLPHPCHKMESSFINYVPHDEEGVQIRENFKGDVVSRENTERCGRVGRKPWSKGDRVTRGEIYDRARRSGMLRQQWHLLTLVWSA